MKPNFRTVYSTVFILAIFFVLSLEQNISSLDLGQNITQITHDVSYNVYIGGYNFIAKLSSKFKLVSSKVSIGPVFEDWNCPNGSAPCDNIVQTLQVLPEIQMLLVCGSAFNGTCTLHRLTDLTNWSCLISDPITSGGLVTSGSQVTSIQWLGVASSNHLDTMNTKEHCRPDNFVENRDWSSQDHELSFDQTNSTNDSYTIFKLMVAQFGHPEYFVVSVRHIISSFSHNLMKYETDRQSIPRILQINTTYRTEQKFSFTETNWTFYIIVGQDTSRRTDVTKLIRLSNDMVQVVEVILTCIHNKTTYPTLTSAVMATMGVLINTQFNAGPVLIASFTRATSVPTRTRHVLCVFSIYDINIKITQELSIEVEPIEETAVLPLQRPVNQIFTFSTSQEKQPTDTLDVFLVDDTFAIYKVGLKVIFRQTRHMFENTSIVSHVSKLDTSVGHWKHVTAGVVDQSKALLYISIGTKVLKLSFDFCRQFDNCQECNENACLWCPDEKLCFDTRHGALSCNWTSEYICKPSITSIRPSEVPIQGGTLLSINGTGFGINSSRVSVTICNQSCDEAVLKNKAITCRVQARSVCDHCIETCEVQFIQYDDQYNQTKYTSESNDKVKIIYVSPQIQSFSPHFGPVSGGYWLQFKGHHLSAGDNASVQVVGTECLNITRNSTYLQCYIPERKHLNEQTGNIKIQIDGFVQTKGFTFKQDPIVKAVHPASTLMSGGSNVNISGNHLNSIQCPRLAITVNDVNTNNSFMSVEQCNTPTSSKHVECKTPFIKSEAIKYLEEKEFLYGTVSLYTDTKHFELKETQIKIYRDPEFIYTKYTSEQLQKTKELKIKGQYIPTWPIPITVSIGSTQCKVKKVSNDSLECSLLHLDEFKLRDKTEWPLEDVTLHTTKRTNDMNTINMTSNANISTSSSEDMERQLPVIVQIGNYRETVGHVFQDGLEQQASTAVINVPLLSGLLTGLVLLVVLIVSINCIIHYRRKQFRKRPVYIYGSKVDLCMQPLKTILSSIVDQVKTDDLEALIITLDKLTFGKPLGSGNFGCVYEGMLQISSDKEPMKVAVKTVKDPQTHNIDLAAFIQEALIMKDFEHPNVLELIGLGEKEPGIPYVILPYMENGDLLTYIRNTAVVKKNNYAKFHLDSRLGVGEITCTNFLPDRQTSKTDRNLSLHEVLKFGADIASGMAYLSSLKFVHRDLAARNCMLDSTYTVKVADFGLCRDIYEKGYYSSDNKKMLPIRWMAIESIEHGSYTTKSDVWSFGIVLWELLTRGLTPYPGIDGWDILNFLRQRRLARPHFCPPVLYKYMTMCWSYKPEVRPTFTSLAFDLYALIGYEQKSLASPSNASEKSVPNFKTALQRIVTDQPTSPYETLIQPNETKTLSQSDVTKTVQTDHYYALLEAPGTISNVLIVAPTCYTLVQTRLFPDLNDHQSLQGDQTYIQVLDHYDPIQHKA